MDLLRTAVKVVGVGAAAAGTVKLCQVVFNGKKSSYRQRKRLLAAAIAVETSVSNCKYSKDIFKSARGGLRSHHVETGLMELIAFTPEAEGIVVLATQAAQHILDYSKVTYYYLTINFPWMGVSLFVADQVLVIAGLSRDLPRIFNQLDTLDGVYVWASEKEELLCLGLRALAGGCGVLGNEMVSPELAVAVAALSCYVSSLMEQRERRIAANQKKRCYEIVELEEEVQQESAREEVPTPSLQPQVQPALAMADSQLTAAGSEEDSSNETILLTNEEDHVEDMAGSMTPISTTVALETAVSDVSSAGRTSGASSPLSELGDVTAVFTPTVANKEEGIKKTSEKDVSKGLSAQAKEFVPSQATMAKVSSSNANLAAAWQAKAFVPSQETMAKVGGNAKLAAAWQAKAFVPSKVGANANLAASRQVAGVIPSKKLAGLADRTSENGINDAPPSQEVALKAAAPQFMWNVSAAPFEFKPQ